MKVSARNQLAGMVKVLNVGVVNAEVVIALPGGMEIAAIISKSSCESLGLKVGSPACAVIKASDVMVGCVRAVERAGFMRLSN
ncbi:MAG: TOBE domain-containing protein, partial [Phycisphaerales bacterium]|nr:TOBE domain-containing protein [Phycisphaerales bacterium]